MALVLQHSFSPSAVPLPRNRRSKSLFSSISCKISNSASSFSSLSFSSNLSLFHHNVSEGTHIWVWPMRAIEKSSRRHSIVCEAAPSKKADSAAKRARQSEKRRLINKSRKSEVRTRMKKMAAFVQDIAISNLITFKLEECKIKFGSGGGRSHSLVPLHYPDYRNDFLGMGYDIDTLFGKAESQGGPSWQRDKPWGIYLYMDTCHATFSSKSSPGFFKHTWYALIYLSLYALCQRHTGMDELVDTDNCLPESVESNQKPCMQSSVLSFLYYMLSFPSTCIIQLPHLAVNESLRLTTLSIGGLAPSLVLVALDVLRRKKGAEVEEVLPVEKLIGEAYSAIDKAVRRGIMHRNTGKHRKSRLARRKRSVLIHHGWYTPATASA
ncbi:hypothetical protein ACLOJK_010781 [Asimina triloba]